MNIAYYPSTLEMLMWEFLRAFKSFLNYSLRPLPKSTRYGTADSGEASVTTPLS